MAEEKSKANVKINIIGAGSAGCYLAYLLAKAGKTVNVYEEHSEIGKPVQCAGIVTSEIKNILDFSIDESVINEINKIEIFSKNRRAEINLREPDLVLDRSKFDKLLYKKALEVGANFYLSSEINDFDRFSFNDILVGADGPLSKVARKIGKQQKIIFAIQARVKLKDRIEENKVKVFLKPKTFLWVIPENKNIARIGMIGKNVQKLEFFICEEGGKVIEWQSGIIPRFSQDIVQKKNIFLLGDAAGQIKETTFGGIVPGLLGARALARAIIRREDYKKNLRYLNRELNIHSKIRKILDILSDKDYDYLVELSNKSRIKEILENTSRDNFRHAAVKILLKEPRLIYFLTKVL